MLEIILLIYLCTKIAKLAGQKNVSKTRWILTTIFYWILGGMLANMLLVYALGIDINVDIEKGDMFENFKIVLESFKPYSMYFMCSGLLGGYLGYLFTRKRIEDIPDSNDAIE